VNKYPKSLEDLIDAYEMLPGVGKKTAERYALYTFFNMKEENIIDFSNAILSVKKDIHTCPICGNITEDDICNICKDESRNKRQVMVLESVKDLLTMEKINEYQGTYHILNGAINFSKGITISDLNIDSLINKVKNKEIDELILATNATLEGETTARYLKELFASEDIKITRLAYGLPVGGDLSYVDEMTILKSLTGRRDY